MVSKSGGKSLQITCRSKILQKGCHCLHILCGSKISSKLLQLSVSEINAFFSFYPEIKVGCQKLWSNDFVKNSPVDSAYITQIFKMVAKSGGKTLGQKVASRLCIYPVGQIFCQNLSLLLRFQDKCIFAEMQKFMMASKIGRKAIFGEKSLADSGDTLWVQKSHSVSEINMFFVFKTEIRDGLQKSQENQI